MEGKKDGEREKERERRRERKRLFERNGLVTNEKLRRSFRVYKEYMPSLSSLSPPETLKEIKRLCGHTHTHTHTHTKRERERGHIFLINSE